MASFGSSEQPSWLSDSSTTMLYSEDIRREVDTQDIMYKYFMTRSCDPMAIPFFGHTHQVAFEFWSRLGSRSFSATFSLIRGLSKNRLGVQYPSRWTHPTFGHQPWMTTTFQSMKRENGCVKQMIRHTVRLYNWLRDPCKVRR